MAKKKMEQYQSESLQEESIAPKAQPTIPQPHLEPTRKLGDDTLLDSREHNQKPREDSPPPKHAGGRPAGYTLTKPGDYFKKMGFTLPQSFIPRLKEVTWHTRSPSINTTIIIAIEKYLIENEQKYNIIYNNEK